MNLVGKKFNRLLAIEVVGRNSNREKLYKCKCDCGNYSIVRGAALKYGLTKSCGCLQREKASSANTKHGMYKSRIYKIWEDMHNRCYQKTYHAYCHYGGRGISICSEWLHDFKCFYDWSMANGYADNLSIDRIDVNGNYEPSNCRWITQKEQLKNRRINNGKYYTESGC